MIYLQKSYSTLSLCHEENEKKRCPYCSGLHTKRKGFIMSSVKTKRGIVLRKTQRYICLDCLKNYSSSSPGTRRRATEELKSTVVEQYVTTKSSLSEVGKRYGIHPSSVNRWMRKAAGNPKSYGKSAVAQTSGYICFDGKELKVAGGKRVLLLASDAKTHQLLCYVYSEKEDSEAASKLLSLLWQMFQGKICGITTDFGKGKCFVGLVRDVFPNASHQICLVHFQRYLDFQLPKSRKSKYYWRTRILRATVKAIIKAPTNEKARLLLTRLLAVETFFRAPYHKTFIKSLVENYNLLGAYREEPELPSTSNAIEAWNRTLQRKLKNMDGFKSDESCKAFLKLWFDANTIKNNI